MTRPAIHEDLLKTLKLWRSGKPIRSLELGHTQRIETRSDETERIDLGHVHRNDQVKIHQWAFHIVEYFAENDAPESFEEYQASCRALAHHNRWVWEQLPQEDKRDYNFLTKEELDAAESLAWKAMLLGWERATSGHDDSKYIKNLQNKTDKAAHG